MQYVDRNLAASRKRDYYEKLDSKSETEQAGYIPPQIQIENMILAGERLNQSRKEQYDFASADEIDEDAYDPTRSGNFDLADATQMAMSAVEAMKKAEEALVAAHEARIASQTAQEGSGEPEPVKGA